MSLNNYVKMSVFGLLCLLSSMPSAQAQWPTFDLTAISTKFQGIKQQIDQYKTQIMESKAVGSINSAIGDAKASMSKFSLDKVEQAKKAAEKAKKEADKIKKVKEDMEKAKKEYEKRKKELDEYKQQLKEGQQMLADAKEMANDAKDLAKQGISDAKSMASDAKSMASDAKGLAKQGVESAKSTTTNKINGATSSVGVSNSSSNNTSKTVQPMTKSQVGNVASQKASLSTANSQVVPNAKLGGAVAGGKINASVDAVQPAVATKAVGTLGTGGAAMPQQKVTPSALSNGTPVSLGTANKGRVAFSPSTSAPTAAAKVSGEEAVSKVKETAAVDGVSAGVAKLDNALDAAVKTRDVEALDAISKIDPSDIVNSKSKIYEPAEGTLKTLTPADDATKAVEKAEAKAAKATEKAAAKAAKVTEKAEVKAATVKDNVKATTDSVSKVKADVSSALSTSASVVKSTAPVKANVSNSLSAATSAVKSTISTPSSALSTSPANSVLQPARKSFQPMQKGSYLWLDDGEYARQSRVKLSAVNTLSFANASCEYNNSMVSKDDGEVVILPATLAKECCIKAEQLEDLNVIKDCANKILKNKTSDDSAVAAAGNEVYAKFLLEQSLFGVAEALDHTNASTSYQKDVLEKYKEKMSSTTPTSGDGTNLIAETNTQLLYLFNRLRQMYSTTVVSMGIGGLNQVNKKVLSEDTEIGLGDIKQEYEASVSRQDIEYPVIPENMAKKCLIKVKESPEKVRDCYIQIVKEMHAKDFTAAEVGENYIANIKYQNVLDVLAKSLYQKVKSAKYDEKLDKTKETNADATTIRAKNDALFNTDYEIQEALDDIVNLMASRVAQTSLENLDHLDPLSTSGL